VTVTLAPGILEEIIGHARKSYPDEGCGLLAGRQTADRFIPVTNIASDPARQFEMEPAELIHSLRELRTSGEQLIAVYHSHPNGPARPSKTDIDRAYYPEAAQIIVSMADPELPRVEAFRIIDGEALPVEVHVIV
jgi:proteasome lid subunit RPN8/RPN11